MAQNKMRLADEVKVFPSLALAPPMLTSTASSAASIGRRSNKDGAVHSKSSVINGEQQTKRSGQFPGLLKTGKVKVLSEKKVESDDLLTFVGFNATYIHFDNEKMAHPANVSDTSNTVVQKMPTMAIVDVTAGLSPGGEAAGTVAPPGTPHGSTIARAVTASNPHAKVDLTTEELRNYTILMDKYSLHNFMIYNGRALRDTPEFNSFRRTYHHVWGAVSAVISSLEKYMTEFDVKLAVVNGPRLYDLAALNMTTIEREDMLQCLSNIDQVKPQLKNARDAGLNRQDRAAIKIQAHMRRCLSSKRVATLRKRIHSAIRIQSFGRCIISRRTSSDLIRVQRAANEEKWQLNREKLERWWDQQSHSLDVPNLPPPASSPAAAGGGGRVGVVADSGDRPLLSNEPRLILHIPSISAAEYLRLDMQNLQAVQNAHIACLHQVKKHTIYKWREEERDTIPMHTLYV